jgi:hypothetical protein
MGASPRLRTGEARGERALLLHVAINEAVQKRSITTKEKQSRMITDPTGAQDLRSFFRPHEKHRIRIRGLPIGARSFGSRPKRDAQPPIPAFVSDPYSQPRR